MSTLLSLNGLVERGEQREKKYKLRSVRLLLLKEQFRGF